VYFGTFGANLHGRNGRYKSEMTLPMLALRRFRSRRAALRLARALAITLQSR
jgi:hypothetical protein